MIGTHKYYNNSSNVLYMLYVGDHKIAVILTISRDIKPKFVIIILKLSGK